MIMKRHPAEILTLYPDAPSKGEITLISAWTRSYDGKGQLMPPRLPLGVLFLATAVVRAGFAVSVRDLQLVQDAVQERSTVKLVKNVLEDAGPILGISCMSDTLPAVLLALTDIKHRRPDLRVILGGSGPGPIAQELLTQWRAVDIVAVGEGEVTLVAVLEAIFRQAVLEDVDGICFREGGQIVCTRRRQREREIDCFLPLPIDAIPLERYSALFPIITTRGCSYRCSFCSAASLWGESITRHSTSAIMAQIAAIAGKGFQRFAIVDDTFVLYRRRVQEICAGMLRSGVHLSWHCNGRIDLQDDALLSTMSEAGCGSIFYGVESGSQSVLERIGKGFTPEQAYRVATQSLARMQTTLSFIWGFPFETWQDFQETRRLYERLNGHARLHYQIHLLTPYPGVPIYQEYAHLLRFDPDVHSDVRQNSLPLSEEEIEAIRRYPRLFPSFYHFITPDFEKKAHQITVDSAKLP